MCFGERPDAWLTVFEALCQHPGWSKPEENVKQFVGVAAQQGASKHGNVFGTRCQGTKCIPLCCVPFQLVHFIRNSIIEETFHITPDEVRRSEASSLLTVCLPERAVQRA